MDVIKKSQKVTIDVETNTDDNLLNLKLNEMLNKEHEKLERDKKLLEEIEGSSFEEKKNDINNNENKNINNENEIKKELNFIEEKKEENNKENEVPKQTLGFFGRLMAPIFLTENEIKNIQNSNH